MRHFVECLIIALIAFLAISERASATAYLGLKMSDAPAAMGGGALVAAAAPNSPAMIAGLIPNDIVIGIDGQRIANAEQLAEAVAARNPGEAATLEVNVIAASESARDRIKQIECDVELVCPGMAPARAFDAFAGAGAGAAGATAPTTR